MTIAVSHPGKMGDALYALPTARLLYGINGEKIDFYTSKYCAPIKRLVEYQPYINEVIIPENYEVQRMDMGCQPWEMPIPVNKYSQVHHLGFRGVPDKAIHQYILNTIGYNMPVGISYEYPNNPPQITQPYVCIAPRGETSFKELFHNVITELLNKGIAVVQIGGEGDNISSLGWDKTGIDMLDTLTLLHHSSGFVGLMSAMLVLANGFDIPRIAVHDGIHWDMSHVIYTARNHYPINPTVSQILQLLDMT